MPTFLNHYRCERCCHEWTDVWSATCEDDCPSCGARHMEPYASEDVDKTPATAEKVSTHWAIVRYRRGGRWYHVSRVCDADGALWEMYWHPDICLRGPTKATIRAYAGDIGIELLDDVLCTPKGNLTMNKLERET